MTQPIDIFDNISPLSLSTRSPTSSFSTLSLDSTLVDLSLNSNDDLASVAPSSPSSSYSFPSSPSSNSDSLSLRETSSLSSCTDPSCCPPPPPNPSTFTSKKTPYLVSEDQFTPLVIVGGGPHSLSLAARLSEPRPAALYTDLEHARLSWLDRGQEVNGEGRKVKTKRKSVKGHWGARKLVSPSVVTLAPRAKDEKKGIRVLDSTSDQWMGRWDGYFKGLRIKHLRSPMLFHPAPADVDALVAYTKRMGAEDRLEPIHNVVGKELSKHQKKKKRTQRVTGAQPINERDRQDYFRPSTPLFNSFISSELIDRYDLSSLVTHSTVTSIFYVPLQLEGQEEQEPFPGFLVRSRNPDGTTSTWASKAVAVAPGPSNRPNIPEVIQRALSPSSTTTTTTTTGPWNEDEIKGDNWCHSSAFAIKGFSPLDGRLGEKINKGKMTTAVVVGGGLTSVQIIDSLLSSGVSHVHLICRSHIKIKHFDFPLTWVDKYNNLSKASFWNSPTYLDRLVMIQQARDGGSINPQFHKLLQSYLKTGQVSLKTLSSITSCSSSSHSGWSISGVTQVATNSKREVGLNEPEEWELNGIDYLVSSTGSKVHLDSLPFLNEMRTSHPIEEVGGLPCINGDLQWNEEIPLFVLGAYSMLELGPDALNLSGTRTGAERVAHRLGQLGVFETKKTVELGDDEQESGRTRREDKQYRSGGEGNFFRGLGEVEA